jgi:CDP-glycerol glycerophosphotransferase
VDNQSFPRDILKRPETTYIQTWHGSALKVMGSDIPSERRKTAAQRAAAQAMVDRFDYFVVRSEHDVRTLVQGLGVKAEILRTGYPRNDALVNRDAAATAATDALRNKLGLPEDKRVLLYAPTFRQSGGKVQNFAMPFDLTRFGREFGDDWVLLIRTHYLNTVVLPPEADAYARNVSDIPDITPLMLLADGLITDYSSVMFDYALLDRPQFFYAYDFEEYTQQERGAYFDLHERAPGPVVHDEDALFEALRDFDTTKAEHADRRADFVRSFGEFDRGTAAKEIVERCILRPGDHR